MNEAISQLGDLLAGRALLSVVFAYSICPYVVLWLAVKAWPRSDDRRRQYLSDYRDVELWKRPTWVGDVAVLSMLDGLALRNRNRQTRRTIRLAGSPLRRPQPGMFWIGKSGGGASIPPFCMLLALPYVVLADLAGMSWAWWPENEFGAVVAVGLAYLVGRGHVEAGYWLEYRRRRWVRVRAVARLERARLE